MEDRPDNQHDRTSSDEPLDRTAPESVDGTVRAHYEWSTTLPSVAVVETVSTAAGRDPTAIESLYEYVDPDALDGLIESTRSSPAGGTASVSFEYSGHCVTVNSTGAVSVRALH